MRIDDEVLFLVVDLNLGGIAHRVEAGGHHGVEQKVVDEIEKITGERHECNYKNANVKRERQISSCIALRYLISRNPEYWS